MTFDQLIQTASSRGASDIHLRAGHVPLVRIDGSLERWGNVAPLSAAALEGIAGRLLSPPHQQQLQTKHEVDIAWQAAGVGRIRASVFRQRGTIAVSMRLIPDDIPTLEELGLPPSVTKLAGESRGLVLVTGATGTGKSTTLAALVDLINQTRALHVITIEDPIEFVHSDKKAVVTQREVGFDTTTYANGLRSALRQDPDVILIGEMRDMDTIETALVAAETGHLVLSTVHTLDAPETINRIVAVFPPHQQGQIRHQLGSVFKAAISQRLVPRADGRGRVLAAEVLMASAFVRDCIEDPDKTASIAHAIVQGGAQYGMQSFDQAILKLCQNKLVTIEEAVKWVTNVEEFKMRLRGITPGSASGPGARDPEIQRFGT
jgi:twitching motility protein PilT